MAQNPERLEIKLIIPKEEKKQLPVVEDKKEREVKVAPRVSSQAQATDPKPLPDDWLMQLAKLLYGSRKLGIGKSHETATEKDYHDHLRRHLGLKKEKPILNTGLEKYLKTIFLLLTDEHPKDRLSENEKTMVYTKMLEDTFECSEGFVIRVNHALISLKAPQSMNELLGHNAQEWLEAALFRAGITEVHSSRFCFKIASLFYPWVKDPNPDDIFPPQLTWVTAEWAEPFVQRTFDKYFTLFPNYQVSRKKIREILGQYGYAGPVSTENYYKEPSAFVKYLAKLFDEPSDTPEAMDQLIETYMVSKKDEALDMEVPVDIHWEAVDKKLYAVLTERYFEIATYTYEHRLAQIINKTGDQAYFKHQLKSVFSPKSCEDLASFDAFIGLENKETHKRIITFLKEFKNNAAEALDELVYAASSFNFSRDEARDLLLHVLAHNPFTTEQILTGKFLSLVYRYTPPLLTLDEQQNVIFSGLSTEQFYKLLEKAASLNLLKLRSVLFSPTFSVVNSAFDIQKLFEKAIQSNHTQAAKWLIEQGANVNQVAIIMDRGMPIPRSPLLHAAHRKNIELVRALLDAGANLNEMGFSSQTILYAVLDNDNFDMIKLLLERGADPELNSRIGLSTLELSERRTPEIKALVLAYRDNPPLCDAVAKGEKERVVQLLKNGANPTRACRDAKSPNYQKTPLMIAATAGNTEIMVELLACQQARDTINQANELKKTALHYAIEHHHPDTVSALLKLGADPCPTLMAAAQQGDPETIRLLLEDKRVQSNQQAKNLFLKKLFTLAQLDVFSNPLYLEELLRFAVEEKDLPLTKFVSENKATVIPPDLFLRAIDLGCTDIAELLVKPVSPEFLESSLCKAVEAGNLRQVRFLLNAKTLFKPALVTQAVELGHVEIAELLIKQSSNLSSEDLNLFLHLAINKTGNLSLVTALLDAGAKLNSKILEIVKEKKDQAFIKCIFTAAVERGEYDMMRQAQSLLAENKERKENVVVIIPNQTKITAAAKQLASHIKAKLDSIISKNTRFFSPLELARCKKASDLLKNFDIDNLKLLRIKNQHPLVAQELSLLKQYCDYSGLADLIPRRKIDTCLKPDDKKRESAKVDELDELGFSALANAVSKNNIGIIKQQLTAGADINLANNRMESTPLHFAAVYWRYMYGPDAEVVQLLLENGADPCAKDVQGEAPLHYVPVETSLAVYEKEVRDKIIKIIKSFMDNPSLCRAVEQNDSIKAAQLIRNNANPNAKNKNGQTALDIARQKKYFDVAKAILEAAEESGKWELAYQACEVLVEDAKGFSVGKLLSPDQRADKIMVAIQFAAHIKRELSQLIEANEKEGFWILFSRTPSLSPAEWVECETLIELLSDPQTLDFSKLPDTTGQHPFVAKKLMVLKKYCEYSGLDKVFPVAIDSPRRKEKDETECVVETKEPAPMSTDIEKASIIIDTKHTIKAASSSDTEPKQEEVNSLFFEEQRRAEAAAQNQGPIQPDPQIVIAKER